MDGFEIEGMTWKSVALLLVNLRTNRKTVELTVFKIKRFLNPSVSQKVSSQLCSCRKYPLISILIDPNTIPFHIQKPRLGFCSHLQGQFPFSSLTDPRFRHARSPLHLRQTVNYYRSPPKMRSHSTRPSLMSQQIDSKCDVENAPGVRNIDL